MTRMTKPARAWQKNNTKYWADCWNTTNPLPEIMNEAESVEFWNKRSEDFAKKIISAQSRKNCRENINFLKKAGVRIKGAKILDIGCGPGTLSLPLARAGAEVTSLDISAGMLGHLKETAKKEDLPIRTIECSWWDADIDKLKLRGMFDLVICSMTPAIKDTKTLDRMIACSRKYCFYIGSLPSTGNATIRDLPKSIIGGSGLRHSQMGMIYPFMYLYLKGYRPEIKINSRKWEEELAWDKAAEHAIDVLSHEQMCSAAMKKRIKDYFKKAATDGKYLFKNEMYLALMIWRVDT